MKQLAYEEESKQGRPSLHRISPKTSKQGARKKKAENQPVIRDGRREAFPGCSRNCEGTCMLGGTKEAPFTPEHGSTDPDGLREPFAFHSQTNGSHYKISFKQGNGLLVRVKDYSGCSVENGLREKRVKVGISHFSTPGKVPAVSTGRVVVMEMQHGEAGKSMGTELCTL